MHLTIGLVVSTLAILTVPVTAQAATCGTITLEGNWVLPIYRDFCHTLERKAVSASVDASCDCDFSKWEQCDAGKKLRIKGRDVTGVPVTEAKAYWCFKH